MISKKMLYEFWKKTNKFTQRQTDIEDHLDWFPFRKDNCKNSEREDGLFFFSILKLMENNARKCFSTYSSTFVRKLYRKISTNPVRPRQIPRITGSGTFKPNRQRIFLFKSPQLINFCCVLLAGA